MPREDGRGSLEDGGTDQVTCPMQPLVSLVKSGRALWRVFIQIPAMLYSKLTATLRKSSLISLSSQRRSLSFREVK